MERKIGEIFEYDGEWYQCVKKSSCSECAFLKDICINNPYIKCTADDRNDNCSVVFKKLEKVGELITKRDRTFQCLKAFKTECAGCVFLDSKKSCDKEYYIDGPCPDNEIWVEIKQNKEDMGDLDKIKVRDYTKVEELNVMEENKLNLKPFDIQKAREGKPVCTRDGRKARIICFDRKDVRPIIALIESDNDDEGVYYYYADGLNLDSYPSVFDLMMLPEKKEGWVNVYKDGDNNYRSTIYTNEKVALSRKGSDCITTIKIEWEE